MNAKQFFNDEVERVKEKNSFRNFITQNYAMKVAFSYVLYPLATIMCMAVSATHLWVNFETTISSPIVAGFLTIVVVVFLEIAKYFSSDSVMDSARAGIFSKPKPHQTAFFVVLTLMILSYAVSVYLDWKGAPIAAEYFKSKTDPVKAQLVNVDSINAYFDARIAGETAVIADAKRMTWKGKVIERGQKLINKAQDNKITIEEQRSAALAAAAADNGLIKGEYEEKKANAGFWFQRLVGVGLLVQFLSMFFVSVYNDGAKYDLEKLFGIDFDGDGHIGAPPVGAASGAAAPGGVTYTPGYTAPGFASGNGSPYGGSGRTPIGFTATSPTPSGLHSSATPGSTPAASTATYCNTTATVEQERDALEGFTDDNLKRIWKDLRKWKLSYDSTRYTKKTREKKQGPWIAQMSMIEDILTKRGVDVAEFLYPKKSDNV